VALGRCLPCLARQQRRCQRQQVPVLHYASASLCGSSHAMRLLTTHVCELSCMLGRGRLLLLTMLLCGSSATTAWLAGGGRWSKRRREFSLASASQHARQSAPQEDQRHGRNLVAYDVAGAALRAFSHAPVAGHACARHGSRARARARSRTRAHGPHARCTAPHARSTAWCPGPDGAWYGDGNAHGLSQSASARLCGATASSPASLALDGGRC